MADHDSGNDEEKHGASWWLIPSARSSQTVRRQQKSLDIDDLKENLLWKSSDDLKTKTGEYTTSTHRLPVGVCSKVVTRHCSKDSRLFGDHEKLDDSAWKGSLPHPSKLKKRKQKRPKSRHNPRHSQYGFDVTAHVAQLKRKHAEFNWFPSHPRNDITSPSGMVDEEPFPLESNGPQCVPNTPTLANDFYEQHIENSELWPWQLPALHNSENGTIDLFMGYQQSPVTSAGCLSIPSYAVATREGLQDSFQDRESHILPSTAGSSASRSEQSSLSPWFDSHSSPDYPLFPISNPLKEE